jgi:hypothetical protein
LLAELAKKGPGSVKNRQASLEKASELYSTIRLKNEQKRPMHGANMNSLKNECGPFPESELHWHGARAE